jgi:uncharacterized protein (TIGR00369 family)
LPSFPKPPLGAPLPRAPSAATGSAELERIHVVTWMDPVEGRKQAATKSGKEYLLALRDGRIDVPVARLMGMTLEEVDDGRVVFALQPAEHHCNPFGTVQGGVAASLLDAAMACAIHSRLRQGFTYATLEISVKYVRPITRETGRVEAIGNVLHVGNRVATAEARAVDSQATLYAHATTTCLISNSA